MNNKGETGIIFMLEACISLFYQHNQWNQIKGGIHYKLILFISFTILHLVGFIRNCYHIGVVYCNCGCIFGTYRKLLVVRDAYT